MYAASENKAINIVTRKIGPCVSMTYVGIKFTESLT